MNRFIKIILAIAGVFVALIVTAVIVLPMLVDPNDYKDEIASAVERQTGRELAIPGTIELSVFPWLGAEIGEARLSNAKGFGDKPFAEIKSADVRVRLLPLFFKRIEIGTVELDGLRLRLARNDKGRTNWDDLTETFASEEATAKAEKQPKKTEGGFSLPEFEIGAIEVDDAAVSWDDAVSDAHYQLSQFNLSTGRLTADEPFRLNAGFLFNADKLGLSAKTNLVADLQADLQKQFYRVGDFSLNVLAKGKAVPGGEQQVQLTGNAEADLQSGRFKVADLMLQGAGVTIDGSIDGNGLNDKPDFNGRLTVRKFNPRSVMKQLAIEPPETTDADVLTSAGLDAQFEGTMNRATFKQILFELDDSTLKGDASVTDFSNPAVGFHLALDHINVDRYMAPGGGGQSGTQPSAKEATSGEINLDALKDLRLDGRVSADRITVSKLNIQNAELAVTARNGVLRVQPLAANLYNGNLRMQSRVDAAGKRPGYAIKGNLNGLKFGPLLKDLIGQDKVDGLANLSVDLTTAGNTVADMKRSLDGTVSFELRDGLFSGFDLAQLLQAARARFMNANAAGPAAGGNKQTPFSRFAATLSVADGVFSGNNLSLKTDTVTADGSGSYNLVANQLDYTIKASVPQDVSGKLSDLKGVTIPIKLSGNLFSPDYSIDIASALKGAAQQRVQKEKAELHEKAQEKKQELNEKLQNKVQEGLSDLFGNKKKKSGGQQEEGAESGSE